MRIHIIILYTHTSTLSFSIYIHIAPDGFTGNPEFWKVAGLSGFFGVLLGFIGLSFLVCAEKIPKLWVQNSSFDTYEDVDFYAGNKVYILITGFTGLIVGILR